MTFRLSWRVAMVWVLSVLSVAGLASALMLAQPRQSIENGQILSGGDIGFRVEGKRGDTPLGTLMIRVDGRWVEAAWAPRLRPAK